MPCGVTGGQHLLTFSDKEAPGCLLELPAAEAPGGWTALQMAEGDVMPSSA